MKDFIKRSNISVAVLSVFLISMTAFTQQLQEDLNYPNQSISSDFDETTPKKYPVSKPEDILNKTGRKREELVVNEEDFHFGAWINYQQQFGAIDNKFVTFGGPSFGFNLGKHFLIGAGVYSSFGEMPFDTDTEKNAMLYGGGIVGFRWNPDSPIVFRTQVLVGAAAFDTISTLENPGSVLSRHTSLIVVPEIAFDIRIAGFFFLTLSASYRYVENLPDAWKSMEGLGALSGNASLGFSF